MGFNLVYTNYNLGGGDKTSELRYNRELYFILFHLHLWSRKEKEEGESNGSWFAQAVGDHVLPISFELRRTLFSFINMLHSTMS